MVPNDDKPKRPIPAAGTVTTYIYEGPITWPRKPRGTERLELIDGRTKPVTYVCDGSSLRLKEPE